MDVILLDGGMGQELIRRTKLPVHADWGAHVMKHEPDIVQGLHEDYLRAGASVITLNTSFSTPRSQWDGFADQQRHAIDLARAAREATGKDAAIAASLPPLEWSYKPDLVEAFETNLADYRQIVEVCAEHVDLIICETMSTSEEARAAATAAAESGKPVWVSWTLDEALAEDGSARLRSGETIAQAVAAQDGIGVDAMLFNCCPPEAVNAGMAELAATGKPCGGYANAFTPNLHEYNPGMTVEVIGTRTDLDPEAYAGHAMAWLEKGATIAGGCCETTPAHISALAGRLTGAGHTITRPN